MARPEFTKREHYVALALKLKRVDLPESTHLFKYKSKLPQPALYIMIHGNAWLKRPPSGGRSCLPTKLTPGTVFGVEMIQQAEASEEYAKKIKAPYQVSTTDQEPATIGVLTLSDLRAVHRQNQMEIASEKEQKKKNRNSLSRRNSIKQAELSIDSKTYTVLTPNLKDPKSNKGPKIVQVEHSSMLDNDKAYMDAVNYKVPKERKKKTPPPPPPKKTKEPEIAVETPPVKPSRPAKRPPSPTPPAPVQTKKPLLVDRATRPHNVAQKKLVVPADYVPPSVPKTGVEADFLQATLETFLPIKTLPVHVTREIVPKLVDSFEKLRVPQNQPFKPTIPKQRKLLTKLSAQQDGAATIGNSTTDDEQPGFFIVQQGTINVMVNGKQVKQVHKGEFVGELALLVDSAESSSDSKPEITLVPHGGDAELFHLEPETYRAIFQSSTKKEDELRQELLQKVPFLDQMTHEMKAKLARTMQVVEFRAGDTLANKQNYGQSFVVVREGTVESSATPRKAVPYFGETWLAQQRVNKHKMAGDMVAKTDGSALQIDPETFATLLGPVEKVVGTQFDSDDDDSDEDVDELTYTDEMLLEGIAQLRWKKNKKLTKKQIHKIQKVLTEKSYHKGQTIWCAGETLPAAMCFVYRGRAERRTGMFKKKFGRRNFFGSQQFQMARDKKTLKMTIDQPIVARKDTVLGELLLEDYLDIFKSEMRRKKKQPKTQMVKRKVSKMVPKSSLQAKDIARVSPKPHYSDSKLSPSRKSSAVRRMSFDDANELVHPDLNTNPLPDESPASSGKKKNRKSSSIRRDQMRMSMPAIPRSPKDEEDESPLAFSDDDEPSPSGKKKTRQSSSLRRDQMRMSMPDGPTYSSGVDDEPALVLSDNEETNESLHMSMEDLGQRAPRRGRKKDFLEGNLPSTKDKKKVESLHMSMEDFNFSANDSGDEDAVMLSEDDGSVNKLNQITDEKKDSEEYVQIEEEEWVEEIVEDDDGDWVEEEVSDSEEWVEEEVMEEEDDLPLRPQRPARSFDLSNIVKRTILGEGQFGQVWLATDKTEDPPHPYAFKLQSKFELIDQDKAEICVAEQQVMKKLDHPNIIKLFASFQDEHFVYMLMDMINGGELFSVIHAPREPGVPWGLPEEQARFYAFVIADAVCYMHESGFIYRDLKPENVLIGNNGYPTLIDFGFAKPLEGSELTFTMVGTPQYIPPEMILQRGHGRACDHWTLGIVAYEMLAGENPFHCPDMEDMELYRGIIEDEFALPKQGGHLAHDFIKKLLVKDDSQRLGSLAGGLADITGHPWFDGLSKRQIQRQQAKAPWVPDLKDTFDVQHFDDWSELEDKSSVDYPPISATEQALFEGFC